MKQLVVVVAICMIGISSKGQSSVQLEYSKLFSGSNIELNIQHKVAPRISISYGLKYFVNRIDLLDSRHAAYYNKFQADSFFEHIGLKFSGSFLIYQSNDYDWSISSFTSVYANYLGIKDLNYVDSEQVDSTGGSVFHEYVEDIQAFPSFDFVLGCEYDQRLAERFGLKLKIGVSGILLAPFDRYFDTPEGEVYAWRQPWTADFPGFSFSIGMTYRFVKSTSD